MCVCVCVCVVCVCVCVCVFILLSVGEMLLFRYVKWSTNFRGLPV